MTESRDKQREHNDRLCGYRNGLSASIHSLCYFCPRNPEPNCTGIVTRVSLRALFQLKGWVKHELGRFLNFKRHDGGPGYEEWRRDAC